MPFRSGESACVQPADPARTIWFGAAAAGVLAVTLLLAYVPLHGPPCLFKETFHLPCPTCGMTRSLMALWHGRFALCFRYHPLGAPLMALCVLLAGIPLAGARAAQFDAWLFRPRSILVGLTTLLLVWLLRLGFAFAGSTFFLW